jgi:hypothetical protein
LRERVEKNKSETSRKSDCSESGRIATEKYLIIICTWYRKITKIKIILAPITNNKTTIIRAMLTQTLQ